MGAWQDKDCLSGTFYVLNDPAFLRFAVFSRFHFRRIIFQFCACNEREGQTRLRGHYAICITLTFLRRHFSVARGQFRVLTFIRRRAMPINCLIFPMLLPFTRYMFLGRAIDASGRRQNNNFRACTTFSASGYITRVRIATSAMDNTSLFCLLSYFSQIVRFLVISDFRFSFFRDRTRLFTTFLFCIFRMDYFKRPLYKIRSFAAAGENAPRACIV